MRHNLKFLTAILILVLLVFACSRKPSRQQEQTTQAPQKQEEPERKDQYRIAEMFTGNKAQIIDLIQGTATFDIEYEGDSTFTARLLNTDGSLVDVLAEVRGNYKGTKTITAPRTGSYILDVKTTGRWSVYRK
jgi:PBP1b-binding outer membrane lipoprotein LpoB